MSLYPLVGMRMCLQSILWRWRFVISLASVILIASGRGSVAAPDIVDFDKLAHFSIYGLLATLVARAGFPGSRAWWAVLLVSLFGLSDEWRQSFTPGRSVEVYDWLADTLGAFIAVTFYTKWERYRHVLEYPLKWRNARVEKSVRVVPN